MNTFESSALRFRPQIFTQLVGQEFVVRTLKAEIKGDRISHAYLFSGPRGVGKTSVARLLAQAINYPHLLDRDVVDDHVDAQWHAIRKGNAIDVIEIDGASHTSVQDVRQIREEVQFAPQQSKYKVYIIDEVHMLSASAFNALLKTIEEPPSYVVFIFATTEVHKVPATVRSRCQQFTFRQIPLAIMVQQLRAAADTLALTASDEVLFWIAKESFGSMRDAYVLFDQIAVLDGGLQDLDRVFQIMGKGSTDSVVGLVEQLCAQEVGAGLRQLHEILNSGVAVERLLSDLCDCYRIVLLRLYKIDDVDILRVGNNDSYDRLAAQYRKSDVIAILDECINLHRNLRTSQQEQYELELCLAKVAHIRDRITIPELVKQVQDIAEQIQGVEVEPAALAPAAPKPAAPTSVPAAPKPATPAPAPEPVAPKPAAPVAPKPAAPAPAPVSSAREHESQSESMNIPIDRAVVSKVCAEISKDDEHAAAVLLRAQWLRDENSVVVYVRDAFECKIIEPRRESIAERLSVHFKRQIAVEARVQQQEALSTEEEEAVSKVKKLFHGEVVKEE